MSLRDWFAGQVLAGLQVSDRINDLTDREVAFECYQLADAMLAERAKREKLS